MAKAAILQSAYIPWRGYFDMIASVDEFVLYDDVQFSHGDWRNRNYIKTPNGPKWMTIPVPKKKRIKTLIQNVVVSNQEWKSDHLNKLMQNYRKAPYYDEIIALVKPVYATPENRLSAINHAFITAICGYLGIKTNIRWSSDFSLPDGKTSRLVEICSQLNCDTYISGPAAKNYLDDSLFTQKNMKIEWFSYDKLEDYPQLHGEFNGQVTILDLLFNCGSRSREFIPALKSVTF